MKRLITILSILTFASCGQRTEKVRNTTRSLYAVNLKLKIEPFNLTVYSSNYSLAYAHKYVLTDHDLQITFVGEIEGEKDSTLFRIALKPSYALHKLSNVNIGSLQEYYENPCIRDGSQLIVKLDKEYKSKTIQLSNYYQEDIGLAVEFINELTPKKYKIWYDKTTLLNAQEHCK